ncbi:PIN domain-containing protein [Rhizobium ruizarguesonis]|uniref:PIN domain-containing protein n=1 Tax=Rhizobium ruizarguesonis TaxID=2081791 RepID=UPI001030100A|nr:PIN domain-containing protein [Rhizobium ruizarguesonis]TBA86278.1 PIN domain-containing protein [Rhizobium ruizarguesonis]
MVVIDASILMLLLRPDAGVPKGADNKPVDRPVERLEHLVGTLEKSRAKIIIPAPALSEVLVRVEPAIAHDIVEKIGRMSVFRIEPFDQRAAIEVATMTRNLADGGNRPGKRDSNSTWAKLKYDRQIVAIAAVIGASAIYSDDNDIKAIARRSNIKVIGLAEIELPPEDAQQNFAFGSSPARAIDLNDSPVEGSSGA